MLSFGLFCKNDGDFQNVVGYVHPEGRLLFRLVGYFMKIPGYFVNTAILICKVGYFHPKRVYFVKNPGYTVKNLGYKLKIEVTL